MCFHFPSLSLSLYSKFCVFAQLYIRLPKPLQGFNDNRWRGHRCTVSKCPLPRNEVFRRLLGGGPSLPEAPAPGPRPRILSPAPSREHHTPRPCGGTTPASVCRPPAPVTPRRSHAAPRPRSWPRPVPRALCGRLVRYKWWRAWARPAVAQQPGPGQHHVLCGGAASGLVRETPEVWWWIWQLSQQQPTL